MWLTIVPVMRAPSEGAAPPGLESAAGPAGASGVPSGEDRPAYASEQERAAAIEHTAGLSSKELAADLAASAMALRTISRQLPDDAWRFPVRLRDSGPFPATHLLTLRLVEVELHHCDLGSGYGPGDWPAAFATMELAEPMRSLREDRLRRAGQASPSTG